MERKNSIEPQPDDYIIKLEAIANSTNESIVLIDLDDKISFFNKSAYKNTIKLYKRRLKIGLNFYTIFPNQVKPIVKNHIEIAKGGKKFVITIPVTLENSSPVWTQINYFPVYNSIRQLTGVGINTTDIDTLKKIEQRLSESENRLRSMFNSRNEVKIFVDKNCQVLYFNQLAQKLALRYHKRPLNIGSDLRDFLIDHTIEEMTSKVALAFEGKSWKEERKINLSSGEYEWVQNEYFPVQNDNGIIIGVSIYTINITARKKSELDLIEKNQQLSDIAQIHSHTIRRPLANILGLIDLISGNEIPDNLKILFQYLKASSRELDEVIHQIVYKANKLDT
jgi:PAS domain S-box-containing protein